MSSYTTTHNAAGKGVFSTIVPASRHGLDLGGATQEIIYSNTTTPPDPSSEADLAHLSETRYSGYPLGTICPPNGNAAFFITMPPGSKSPMHRTLTIDVGCVISGEVELELDSGEKRVMKAGDSSVMRGTMHRWRNTSDTDEAKLFAHVQSLAQPLIVGGKEVQGEFLPEPSH